MEVVAAAFGVADITARASSQLWKLCEAWRDAPSDIYHLRDDLSRSEDFFECVKQGLDNAQHVGQKTSARLLELLQRGADILTEIGAVVEQVLDGRIGASTEKDGKLSPSSQPLRARRKLVWLTKAKSLRKLKGALMENRELVYGELVSLNVMLSVELHSVVGAAEKNVMRHLDDALEDQTSKLMARIDRSLEISTNDMMATIESRLSPTLSPGISPQLPPYTPFPASGRATEQGQQPNTSPTTETSPTPAAPNSKAQGDQIYVTTLIEQTTIHGPKTTTPLKHKFGTEDVVNAVSSHIDNRMQELESRLAKEIALQMRAHSEQIALVASRLQDAYPSHRLPPSAVQQQLVAAGSVMSQQRSGWWPAAISRAAVRMSATQPTALCDYECACQCHVRKSYSNWKMSTLQAVAGYFLISTAGVFENGSSCTVAGCKGSSRGKWLQIHYRFPAWLTKSAISLFLGNPAGGSPEMVLRVPRKISRDSCGVDTDNIYAYILKHDVDGLKRYLERHPYAVFDEHVDNDSSPLREAMTMDDVNLVKVLMQAGADLFHPGGEGASTPMDIGFNQILWGTPLGQQLAQIPELPLDEYIENGEFSQLQKIIIGILPLDLGAALRKPQFVSQINYRDRKGDTALHLAAAKGNLDAVGLLLDAGADPNALSEKGGTPLHQGATQGNYDIVKRLLDAGADVNARMSFLDVTPLHRAADTLLNGNLAVTKLLLDYGADVNALMARYEVEPLVISLFGEQPQDMDLIRCLVRYGARLNHQDWEGDTPLLVTVQRSLSKSLGLLLELGADYRLANHFGRGVLHQAAVEGDEQVMRVLAGVGMKGVDAEAVDAEGKTAKQLLDERVDLTPELKEAFGVLLASVVSENDLDIGERGAGGEAQNGDYREGEASDDEFFDSVENHRI